MIQRDNRSHRLGLYLSTEDDGETGVPGGFEDDTSRIRRLLVPQMAVRRYLSSEVMTPHRPLSEDGGDHFEKFSIWASTKVTCGRCGQRLHALFNPG